MVAKRSGFPQHRNRRSPLQERSRFLVSTLLEATERSLAHRGLARVSVRGIARVAGVGVGSLYQYFDGKGSLVRALIDQRFENDLLAVRELLNEATDKPLEECIREGIALLVPEPAWKKDAMVEMVDALEEVDRSGKLRALLDSLVDLIEGFLRDHPELDLGETRQRARMIVFGVRAAALEEMRVQQEWDPVRVRRELVRMTCGILGTRGPSSN